MSKLTKLLDDLEQAATNVINADYVDVNECRIAIEVYFIESIEKAFEEGVHLNDSTG